MPPAKFNKYPFWTARFWHGMRVGDWTRLAWGYGGRVSPSRWPMAVAITGFSLLNSLGDTLQRTFYTRRIRESTVAPPVFIVGHWRSGTTMLHELMTCDERFNYPTTYQCFAPHHFLVSQWWAARLLWFLVPKQRPMDNMSAGMDLPQEDEFALMNLGAPSPYCRMAYPNVPAKNQEYLDFDGVPTRALAEWSQKLTWFAKTLTLARDGALVFKSPTHTGRIGHLAKLFPDAKFIHISRHPHSLFPSTMRLWKALDSVQGLQTIRNTAEDEAQREEYVLSCLERMYSTFDRQRQTLADNQFFQIRYEELIERPVDMMEAIYGQLELPDFDAARPQIQAYWDQRKDYRPNPHPELPAHIVDAIRSRWAKYAEMYGYEV